MEINIGDILRQVYGAKGYPFPANTNGTLPSVIAADYDSKDLPEAKQTTDRGFPLRSINNLGNPVFMPATLNGYELPNPLITITGEKAIVETDIVGVGTVFEKIYDRPYDITIICTLFGEDGQFPEKEIKELVDGWEANQVLTLECALTDFFLTAENNFVLTRISLLDMEGIEHVQVVQLDGRSNIEFELEIKD
jgi:hypothetical protein